MRILATLLLCLAALPAHAEIASCYGREHHQVRTATGENYDPWRLTAAMLRYRGRPVPFGTRVLITNLRNGRTVTVTINDRGPFVKGRSIDLSLGSCRAIGSGGIALVSLEVLR